MNNTMTIRKINMLDKHFTVHLKSYNNKEIEILAKEFQFILSKFGSDICEVGGIVSLPTKKKYFCVLRSPHVDKNSREQFGIRLYEKFINFKTDSIFYPFIVISLFNYKTSNEIFIECYKIYEFNL